MDPHAKETAAKEWNHILKEHPQFAAAFIAQQMILVDMSERQDPPWIRLTMCDLVALGYVFPFFDYWNRLCTPMPRRAPVNSTLDCLAKGHDPAGCIHINNHEWFDDPFANGRQLPPMPGPGPLRT